MAINKPIQEPLWNQAWKNEMKKHIDWSSVSKKRIFWDDNRSLFEWLNMSVSYKNPWCHFLVFAQFHCTLISLQWRIAFKLQSNIKDFLEVLSTHCCFEIVRALFQNGCRNIRTKNRTHNTGLSDQKQKILSKKWKTLNLQWQTANSTEN